MRYTVGFIFLVLSFNLKAQEKNSTKTSDYSNILYGVVYEPENYNSVGHPFFSEDKFLNTSLIYNGQEYNDLRIKYDVYNQNIILYQDLYPDQYRFLKLNNNLIKEFVITDHLNRKHYFKTFDNLSDQFKGIKFYEVVYENGILYLIIRSKEFQELAIEYNKNRFLDKSKHLIIKNGEIHLFKNKRSFLLVFSEKKKELKKYIRREKLKVKLDKPENITRIIKYLDKL